MSETPRTFEFYRAAFKELEEHQGQCDEDGVAVAVSREALTYALEWFAAANTKLAECVAHADAMAEDLDASERCGDKAETAYRAWRAKHGK